MSDQDPIKAQKEILSELRSTFRSAKVLIKGIETAYAKNQELVTALSDKDNGAKANLEWAAKVKKQISENNKKATDSLDKLTAALES